MHESNGPKISIFINCYLSNILSDTTTVGHSAAAMSHNNKLLYSKLCFHALGILLEIVHVSQRIFNTVQMRNIEIRIYQMEN